LDNEKGGFLAFLIAESVLWNFVAIIEIQRTARHQDENRSYNSVYYPMRMSRFEFFEVFLAG